MSLKKYYYALDLKDNEKLIQEYKKYHEKVWPEITGSFAEAGVEDLEIYNAGNRLFMIMTVNETFTFEKKAAMDAANPKVDEWEDLMWNYQQALPFAEPGQKWVQMDKIFTL